MVKERNNFMGAITQKSELDAVNTAKILERLGIVSRRLPITTGTEGSVSTYVDMPEHNKNAFQSSLDALMALSPEVRSKIVELLKPQS